MFKKFWLIPNKIILWSQLFCNSRKYPRSFIESLKSDVGGGERGGGGLGDKGVQVESEVNWN